ncbi:MAG: DNA polymerase II, partial [Spirochaetaceae bacterium]|nr:DNA polymerase II [Spirochaetaceae bacterium]
PRADDIVAPNGARFDRTEGVLPSIITRYAAERERALAAGDDTAAYVYKILQNSFYGVLGAEGCRYARTELAGAITSFGRKYLLESRDFFEARGYRVLYGDTDSVFVESGRGAAAPREELSALGEALAAELNAEIQARVAAEYGLESRLRIRCEKLYRRFFIPRLRIDAGGEGARGRAKGYAGLRLEDDGAEVVEVKGMEAARSDWTPLARRFQVELLGLVFRAAGEEEVRAYCRGVAAALRRGDFDGELVYRKYLRRAAEDYGSETPQVRAARLLGWEGRRGAVSYVMTKSGAEPASLRSGAPLDYGHYVERQLLPIARAVADALRAADGRAGEAPGGGGWNAEAWLGDRPQLELGL